MTEEILLMLEMEIKSNWGFAVANPQLLYSMQRMLTESRQSLGNYSRTMGLYFGTRAFMMHQPMR